METSRIGLLAGITVLILLAVAFYYTATRQAGSQSKRDIDTYDECIAAGGIVTLSYPSQCRLPDGGVIIQPVPPEEQPRAPVSPQPSGTIDSYDACVAAGYPVTMSYPSTCRMPDGRIFTEPVSEPPTAPSYPY